MHAPGSARVALASLSYLALTLWIPPSAGADCPALFGVASNFVAGTNPHAIVVADLNADGIPDLAVANSNSSQRGNPSVSIHLGLGDGHFAAPTYYGTGAEPLSLVARDLDGDGILDLAVSSLDGSVFVLRGRGSTGHGDGTFDPAVSFPAGSMTFSIVAGDLNGDGITDLVVTNQGTSQVSVLLGQGVGAVWNGSFAAPVSYLVGTSTNDGAAPTMVAIGDFNHDGIADLAVTLTGADQVAILLGNGSGGVGDGTFAARIPFGAGMTPWDLAVADLDADGALDLIVSDYGSGSIAVLRGHGDGSFSAPVFYPAGSRLRGLVLGDFDGDGIADVAVADEDLDVVDVLTGQGAGGVGNGAFSPPSPFSAGPMPFGLAKGDLNRDGHTDLAVACGPGYVSTLLGCRPAAPPPSLVGRWAAQGQPVCTAAGDQYGVVGVPDGEGGVILAWQDHRGSTWDIYAQRLTPDGTVAPGWVGNGTLVSPLSGNQTAPDIAADGAGGVLIVWQDDRNGNPQVFVQHVLASGSVAPGWPADGLQLNGGSSQVSPLIVSDASGGAVLAWFEASAFSSGAQATFAQRITGAGQVAPGWPSAGLSLGVAGPYTTLMDLHMAPDEAGGAYLVSTSHYQHCDPEACRNVVDTGGSLIYADGTFDTAWSQAIGISDSASPFVGLDASGGAITAAFENASYGDRFLVAERTAPGGAQPWNVLLSTTNSAQLFDAIPDGSGGSFLAWSDAGAGLDLLATRLDASGQPGAGWSSHGSPIFIARGDQYQVRLASDNTHGFYATWTDTRQDIADIYATHLRGDASIAPGWAPNGNPVCNVTGNHSTPVIVADGLGGSIVAWQDHRATDFDIYAQKLSGDQPVPVEVSLVSTQAEPRLVRITWQVSGVGESIFHVQRRELTGDWQVLGALTPDGTGMLVSEDRTVEPAHRYDYRLAVGSAIGQRYIGETWVETPSAYVLALAGARPNPAVRVLNVAFTLPSAAPTTLELVDVTGRRIESRMVGSLGPGPPVVELGPKMTVAPGIYFVRLIQGHDVRTTRVCLVR